MAAQLRRGSAWGGNNRLQGELAEAIVARVPSIDLVRFTNSGTEAAHLALLLARAATGRHKILMAQHGYHGQLLEFQLGSFHGLVEPRTDLTFAAPYNDAAAFEAILAEHGSEIAAVFLAPVMFMGGVIGAKPEFVSRIRDAATAVGALLVFDEVVTFRLAPGNVPE